MLLLRKYSIYFLQHNGGKRSRIELFTYVCALLLSRGNLTHIHRCCTLIPVCRKLWSIRIDGSVGARICIEYCLDFDIAKSGKLKTKPRFQIIQSGDSRRSEEWTFVGIIADKYSFAIDGLTAAQCDAW